MKEIGECKQATAFANSYSIHIPKTNSKGETCFFLFLEFCSPCSQGKDYPHGLTPVTVLTLRTLINYHSGVLEASFFYKRWRAGALLQNLSGWIRYPKCILMKLVFLDRWRNQNSLPSITTTAPSEFYGGKGSPV